MKYTIKPQSDWCSETRNFVNPSYTPGATVEVTGNIHKEKCRCGLDRISITNYGGGWICPSRLVDYLEQKMGLDNSTAGAFVRQNHTLDAYNYSVLTNGQEKEEKVFQVTYENLATGGVSNEQFKTQEEAQLHLESKVAGLRSSVQVKNFFTVSLLNAKTGVFLGSVTDAPPAVVLVNASPAPSTT